MRSDFGLIMAALCSMGLCASAALAQPNSMPPAPPPPPAEPPPAPPAQPPPASLAGPEASHPWPAPAADETQPVSAVHEPRTFAFEQRSARNALYLELLGNALFYSLNYERFLSNDVSLRVGAMFFSVRASDGDRDADGSATVLILPLMVNYLGIGSADNMLELGLGISILYASARGDLISDSRDVDGATVAGTATIGYRHAPHDGGFHFKIGLTPVFGLGGFLPWPGISFGAVF